MKRLPGKLGECVAVNQLPALLSAEAVLLTTGCIPDPVDEEVGSEEEDESWDAEGGN